MRRINWLVCITVGLAWGCSGPPSHADRDDAGPGADAASIADAPLADAWAAADARPAPAAPSAFQASWNETTLSIDLTWTNPASVDFSGVVIVRQNEAQHDVPVDGATYSIGQVLPLGGLVIYAGPATFATDTVPRSGTNHYRAWAYGGERSHSSEPAEATVTQVPTLRIDITDPLLPGVTVVSHPWPLRIQATTRLTPASVIIGAKSEGEIIFTAAVAGAAGNGATVNLVDGGDGSALTVAVTGTSVVVTFDQYVHGAAEIAAAVNNNLEAFAVMTAQAPIDGIRVEPVGPVTLEGGSDTALRVRLRATNVGLRPLFNAKTLIETTGGVPVGRFSLSGKALAYFGYAGLDTGASAVASFDLQAYAGAFNPIVIDLTERDDPMVVISGSWRDAFVALDSSGSGAEVQIAAEPLSYAGVLKDGRFRDGFATPDGRMMYLGNHTMPMVVGVDLMTLRPSVSVNLDDGTGVGHVDSVTPSPDFSVMYAVVTYGAHGNAWAPPGLDQATVCATGTCMADAERVELVKLRLSDLSEIGRLTLLATSNNGVRGRNLTVSTDGRTGAVALYREGKVAIVDLETMTMLRNVDVLAVGLLPQHAAIAPAGNKTYVAFKDQQFNSGTFVANVINDGKLQVIDHADWSISPLAPPTVEQGAQPGFLEFGPDGRLYYGRKNMSDGIRLSVFDLLASSWSTVSPAITWPRGVAFTADGSRLFVFDGSAVVRVVQRSTLTQLQSIPSELGGFGHVTIVTPF